MAPVNENVNQLLTDLQEKKADAVQAAQETFKEQMELTADEAAHLEANKKDSVVMVSMTDNNGNETKGSVSDFVQPLDRELKSTKLIDQQRELEEQVRLINSGDITENVDTTRAQIKEKIQNNFKALAVGLKDADDNVDYQKINESAFSAIENYFETLGISKKMHDDKGHLRTDDAVKYLNKIPMKTLLRILPDEFLRTYMTDMEIKTENISAKERLLTTIAYMATTGPDYDYLNEYIDNEERRILVTKRLAQCDMEFSKMLTDERTLAEMVAESKKISPDDDSVWQKYISDPRKVHSIFAQSIVIYQQYKKNYEKLLEEYPDTEENASARELILDQIDESDRKIEVYSSICDLSLMKELWDILVARFKNDRRLTMDYLMKQALDATEKTRRCKQNLPFPGFKGTERKAEQILTNYQLQFTQMVKHYNETIAIINDKNKEENLPTYGVEEIHFPECEKKGISDALVFNIFGMMLCILMGRILKRCTKNDANRFDAITLDAYYKIFCNLGTDVYMMTCIWNMMKPFICYLLDRFCVQVTSEEIEKEKAKQQKRAAATKRKNRFNAG